MCVYIQPTIYNGLTNRFLWPINIKSELEEKDDERQDLKIEKIEKQSTPSRVTDCASFWQWPPSFVRQELWILFLWLTMYVVFIMAYVVSYKDEIKDEIWFVI